jgi:hypothetical protein
MPSQQHTSLLSSLVLLVKLLEKLLELLLKTVPVLSNYVSDLHAAADLPRVPLVAAVDEPRHRRVGQPGEDPGRGNVDAGAELPTLVPDDNDVPARQQDTRQPNVDVQESETPITVSDFPFRP